MGPTLVGAPSNEGVARPPGGRIGPGAHKALRLVVVFALGFTAGVFFPRGDNGSTDLATAPPTTSPDRSSGGWTLVWSDAFNRGALDLSKWAPENSTFGDANNELQCYTPENVTESGGNLHLQAQRQPTSCPNGAVRGFSSGLVRSRAEWAFGAFEIRAKVPPGAGFFPAFWLLPRNYPYGRDGLSGELDIGEVVTSAPADILGTAHWSQQGCGWGCSKYGDVFHLPGLDATAAFHTYRLEWTPRSLKWFVDGVGYFELGDSAKHKWASAADHPAPGSATYPAPFDEHNPMYLILNLAVGGNTPGPPNASTPFPSSMDVDYVKVFRQNAK